MDIAASVLLLEPCVLQFTIVQEPNVAHDQINTSWSQAPKNPCNLPKAATPIKRSAAFRGRSSLDKLFWTQSSTSLAVLGARLIPMDQVLSINFKWDKLDSELATSSTFT